jgi:DNA-binding GntR family transcriptional regulator
LAKELGIEPGQAVLLLEETLFDKEGTAIEFSHNYFIPEFFRFYIVRR